jgi:hypothetical protein
MRTKLDGKFHGVIVKNKDGSIVPQDEWIVFLAKDDALLPTLKFYEKECERIGAQPEQLKAISELIERVAIWRRENMDKCKVPDVDRRELVL